MTLVDTVDLTHRTCPLCGVVVGDALRHRRYHREEEERVEATLEVLRDLVADIVERRTQAT